jgi:DNA-binding NarL/FixJ family response regulator
LRSYFWRASNKEIAWQLGIHHRTVESHRTVAYRKLRVRTGIQLYRRLLEMKAERAAA